jgi:hypothetical protein
MVTYSSPSLALNANSLATPRAIPARALLDIRGDAACSPELRCNRQLLKQLKPQIGRGYLCLIEEHSKFVSAGRAEVFGIQT